MSNSKVNLSSMQVLKTLHLLLEGNYSMTELVEKLNQNEPEPIFNNSVVSKYINTCRYCGIEILKIQNKYFVAHLPFGLDLTGKDIELLEKLQYIAQKNFTNLTSNKFNTILDKISKYSNKHITRVEKKTAKLTLELFEKAVQEKRKVILMYKAKTTLECIPVSMEERDGIEWFNIIYKGKNKSIRVERVSGVEILDKTFGTNEFWGQKVLYKLTGDLAKRYIIREDEEIVMQKLPEYVTVANTTESKEELFTRFLRYDSSCEIISPQSYRDEMKALLNNMLRNYGV